MFSTEFFIQYMTKNKSAGILHCCVPALDALCIILCSTERPKFCSHWRQVEEGNGKWECHKKTSCTQIKLRSFRDVTLAHEELYLSPSNCSPTCNDHVTQGGVSARRCHPCSIRQRVKPPPFPGLHFSACNPAIIPDLITMQMPPSLLVSTSPH